MNMQQDPRHKMLEARTIDAHRAYIRALADVERCRYELGRSIDGVQAIDQNSLQALAYHAAEHRLHDCRRNFALLLAELGYIPALSEARLPEEPF